MTIPPLKHFGPLLVVWGAAMLMLVFIRDLGSSLMYFGGFLALLYVATNRLSFVVIGMGLFAVGAWFFANTVSHVQDRVNIWLDPFNPEWVEREGYQIAQSLFAQADGGLFGTGLGASLLNSPEGTPLIPVPSTDLIYAVIANELGLVGACGLILVYMLLAERGFRTATLASDSFSKLLAAGPERRLRAPGVRDRRRRHARDPADRRHAAVRLLRRLLDPRQLRPARAAAAGLRPRAPAGGRHGPEGAAVNAPIIRLFGLFLVLFAVLVAFTSRWTVFEAEALRENPNNRRVLFEEQRIKRGIIRAARRPGAGRQPVAAGRSLRAPLSRRASCSRTRSASRRSTAGGSASRSSTTTR